MGVQVRWAGRTMLLPRLAAIDADGDEVGVRVILEARRGMRGDTHGNFALRSYREVTRTALRMNAGALGPRLAAIGADCVIDTLAVIPDDVRGTVGPDFHPRSIVPGCLRELCPGPVCTGIATHADVDLRALIDFAIESHRDEIKRAVASNCEIDIGIPASALSR
jgi:hypothetical protein